MTEATTNSNAVQWNNYVPLSEEDKELTSSRRVIRPGLYVARITNLVKGMNKSGFGMLTFELAPLKDPNDLKTVQTQQAVKYFLSTSHVLDETKAANVADLAAAKGRNNDSVVRDIRAIFGVERVPAVRYDRDRKAYVSTDGKTFAGSDAKKEQQKYQLTKADECLGQIVSGSVNLVSDNYLVYMEVVADTYNGEPQAKVKKLLATLETSDGAKRNLLPYEEWYKNAAA